MFSENNIKTTSLATCLIALHCSLIYLQGKISKFWMKKEGYVCKSGICDTKRSGLEPKLLQSVYRNSCTAYRLVANLVTYRKLWPTFPGATFSITDIAHTSCRSATKFGRVRGLANWSLFLEFRGLFSGDPVIPCGDMHQSFTDTLVKWFFNSFPIFADSFGVISIHCVARGLGASFLYKCPASRGSFLRQHCLLVNILTLVKPIPRTSQNVPSFNNYCVPNKRARFN